MERDKVLEYKTEKEEDNGCSESEEILGLVPCHRTTPWKRGP